MEVDPFHPDHDVDPEPGVEHHLDAVMGVGVLAPVPVGGRVGRGTGFVDDHRPMIVHAMAVMSVRAAPRKRRKKRQAGNDDDPSHRPSTRRAHGARRSP
ncbi:MAG: hypothetical protein GWO05_00605 [Gammaproteobacteria bacterium]|nr:hypothetical protein [Gammaproteobacteria bacterium]